MRKVKTEYGIMKDNLKAKRDSASKGREEAKRSEQWANETDVIADEIERMLKVLEANGFSEVWREDPTD